MASLDAIAEVVARVFKEERANLRKEIGETMVSYLCACEANTQELKKQNDKVDKLIAAFEKSGTRRRPAVAKGGDEEAAPPAAEVTGAYRDGVAAEKVNTRVSFLTFLRNTNRIDLLHAWMLRNGEPFGEHEKLTWGKLDADEKQRIHSFFEEWKRARGEGDGELAKYEAEVLNWQPRADGAGPAPPADDEE